MNKLNYSNTFLLGIFCILIAGNSFSIASVKPTPKQLVVVIDPGHGGKDPGAVNKNIREKDIVLGIGLKLGKLINENYPEVKVVFTRSSDVFIPLIDRSRIANKNKANLFISLHANACSTPSTKGTETFFLGTALNQANLEIQKKENSVILLEEDYSTTYEGFDPNSSESDIMFANVQSGYLDLSLYFADAIQQQFKSRIESPNRGVKQAGFLVLRLSSMPSVLVEAGFLSNKEEANYLNSDEGQQHIALSVFEAFKKFKNKNSGTANTRAPEMVASSAKPQEEVLTQDIGSDIQKTEEKTKEEIIVSKIDSEITEPEKVKTTSSADETNIVKTGGNAYFSVQIGANKTPMEPIAANFKGLKNVRREKDDQYYRYYVGNENAIDNLGLLLKQAKLKFPQAFIVSFVDGKRIPINVVSK